MEVFKKYIDGNCLKRGRLGQFSNLGRGGGGGLGKKEGDGVLEGEVDTPMHTMHDVFFLVLFLISSKVASSHNEAHRFLSEKLGTNNIFDNLYLIIRQHFSFDFYFFWV